MARDDHPMADITNQLREGVQAYAHRTTLRRSFERFEAKLQVSWIETLNVAALA